MTGSCFLFLLGRSSFKRSVGGGGSFFGRPNCIHPSISFSRPNLHRLRGEIVHFPDNRWRVDSSRLIKKGIHTRIGWIGRRSLRVWGAWCACAFFSPDRKKANPIATQSRSRVEGGWFRKKRHVQLSVRCTVLFRLCSTIWFLPQVFESLWNILSFTSHHSNFGIIRIFFRDKNCFRRPCVLTTLNLFTKKKYFLFFFFAIWDCGEF